MEFPAESLLINFDNKKGVHFFYGSFDWMDTKGARRVSEKRPNTTYDVISKSGH